MSLQKTFVFFVLLCISKLHCQEPGTMRFKKEQLYFFQKGLKQDTMTTSRKMEFYLVVPDTLKRFLSIYTENARLAKTTNDSIVRLTYFKGFKYECIFDRVERPGDTISVKNKYEFRTLINGTTEIPPDKIIIIFYNRQTEEEILVNSFYYRK